MDVGASEPLESSGLHHWRESTITEPGLTDRGDVFFAAVEMTRMPMILTDPNQADNPIVFANKAFLDLTMYEEEEVLGRNCRFLQGAQTDRQQITEMRQTVQQRDSIALEVLNYKRDGTPFWNAVSGRCTTRRGPCCTSSPASSTSRAVAKPSNPFVRRRRWSRSGN